jgi:hypothetical protein
MRRFQGPPSPEPLNHTLTPHVNSLPAELIDGKGVGITHMAGDEARYISAALVHGYDPINSAFYFIIVSYSQALSGKFFEI